METRTDSIWINGVLDDMNGTSKIRVVTKNVMTVIWVATITYVHRASRILTDLERATLRLGRHQRRFHHKAKRINRVHVLVERFHLLQVQLERVQVRGDRSDERKNRVDCSGGGGGGSGRRTVYWCSCCGIAVVEQIG